MLPASPASKAAQVLSLIAYLRKKKKKKGGWVGGEGSGLSPGKRFFPIPGSFRRTAPLAGQGEDGDHWRAAVAPEGKE